MKSLNYYLVLFSLLFPFSLFALVPYPIVNEEANKVQVKAFVDMSMSNIEQKLNKQLTWHEKMAFNSLKRKLKRQAKKNPDILETQLNLKEEKPFLYQFLMALLGLLILVVIGIIIIAISCSGGRCFGP